jgi:hypothetical protein
VSVGFALMIIQLKMRLHKNQLSQNGCLKIGSESVKLSIRGSSDVVICSFTVN